jgi:hypothetical protein
MSRFSEYRDRLRGGPARVPNPCGTVAAARRHQRSNEPLCALCRLAWAEHQHAMYLRRQGQ